MTYNIDDYNFKLPEELIAQYPAEQRDQSRLLIYHSKQSLIEHGTFANIGDYLRAGDVLVMNNTKVIPARIRAKRETGGKIEIFLVRPYSDHEWLCMVKPSKKMTQGVSLSLSESLDCRVLEELEHGYRKIGFEGPRVVNDLKALGDIPLPPYIKRDPNADDEERYQTVFATQDGAVAAPTAGLHFTEELLEFLYAKGVQTVFVTLHVGPGTFKPVVVEDIRDHHVDQEYFEISEGTIEILKKAKQEGRRIISVGTTTTRVLESLKDPWTAGVGWTDLYIYSPYRPKVIDGLITNFHLPKSSLLLLVAAFIGHDDLMLLYRQAVAHKYRFYSYGDASLLLRS